MKRSASKSWPGVDEALKFAQLSLQAPPGVYLAGLTKAKQTRMSLLDRVKHIERWAPRGMVRFRATLPLDCCINNNQLMRIHFGRKHTTSKRIYDLLFEQNGCQHPEPVAGRPLVRFVRFSALDPDEESSWMKLPLDVLTQGRRGGGRYRLGFLTDDSRKHIELRYWWEPAPAKLQFVYLDIWEGRDNELSREAREADAAFPCRGRCCS